MKEDQRLGAGVATVDITPLYPVALTGYVLREGKSTGVLDALSARALYLEQAGTRVLVIVCDVLGLSRAFVAGVRAKIQAETGIPGQNIMIACTHTHSGPATLFLWECGELEMEYLGWLEGGLVEAARQASKTVTPVTVLAGKTDLTGVSENRRAEGGPIDPEMVVTSLVKEDGEKLAILFNYTCHPTSLQYPNMQVSGDYPGHTMRLVEEAAGVPALYFNGATGNIRPIRRNSLEAMQSTAEPIARAALSILDDLQPAAEAHLMVAQKTVEIAFQRLPGESELVNVDFTWDRPLFYVPERTALMDQKQVRIIDGWRRHILEQLRAGQLSGTLPSEVQVIRLGAVALVGVGGELFVELGLELKQRAGLEHLMIACYTNDDVGYIPARHAYEHGGYELEESFILHNYPSVLAPTAGEQIVATALDLIQATQPTPEPRR